MNKPPIKIFLLLATVLIVSGCASSRSGDVYSRHEARQEMQVEFGVVEHMRSVLIEGTDGGVGTVAGGLVGGIAGSGVGGGRGSAVAAVLGAVVGGVVGASIEQDSTQRDGLEITVRLESGAIRAYVQEASPNDDFMIGDRVRVIHKGGVARVTR